MKFNASSHHDQSTTKDSFVDFGIFSAHPTVLDPVQRRIASLMAMFHLLSIPIAPAALYVTNYTRQGQVPMNTKWVVIIIICAIFNYTLARSRWYQIAFYAQVIAAFCVCYWTALHVPARQSLHFLVVLLPTLMAAHLMSNRELIIVSVASMIGLSLLYLQIPQEAQRLLLGSSFSLIPLLMLILLIRHHHSWVERVRRQKLASEYARFQSLMEAAYDTTLTLENGVITQLDRGAIMLFERPYQHLKGMSINELLTIADLYSPNFGETAIMRPNGKIGYALFAVEPLSEKETFIALRDVTKERLETAHQLQLDRMTQTATLASGIAHEFNTPLMVVMNQLRKLQHQLADQKQELVLLNSAQEGLQQLTEIIKDLKWFIQPATTYCESPGKVIENTVRLARHRIRHQSEIIIEHPEEKTLEISDNQLSQLLLNLLFNANEAKASNQERIHIQIVSAIEDERFVLKVVDDGIGMSPEVQSRIFQPFFTHGKIAGTGLGLAICNSIVSQSGGSIDVVSQEGEGTTVTIVLPLAKSASVPIKEPVQTSILTGTKLVIDDDYHLSTLVAEMLGINNTKNLNNITEAKTMIESEDISLILCDLNMPNGGAQTLHKHLVHRKHPAMNRMIVMTGGAVDPLAQTFLNETNLPILYKPFGHGDFMKAISQLNPSG